MATRIRMAWVVYGCLAVLAFVWATLAGRPRLYAHPEPVLALHSPMGAVASLVMGLVLAGGIILMTRGMVRRTTWGAQLHRDFRSLLGPLRGGEIAVLALTSGVAEELFFRGAMQPAFGLIPTALLFGVLHIAPFKRAWIWTVWAVAMGFAFGSIFELTGSLLGPLAAHVLINYENMHFIDGFDPGPPAAGEARTIEEPRLISRAR